MKSVDWIVGIAFIISGYLVLRDAVKKSDKKRRYIGLFLVFLGTMFFTWTVDFSKSVGIGQSTILKINVTNLVIVMIGISFLWNGFLLRDKSKVNWKAFLIGGITFTICGLLSLFSIIEL